MCDGGDGERSASLLMPITTMGQHAKEGESDGSRGSGSEVGRRGGGAGEGAHRRGGGADEGDKATRAKERVESLSDVE